MREKLTCPYCQQLVPAKVIDSRPFAKREGVYRKRVCQACGKAFTTEEQVRAVYQSGAVHKSTTTSSSADDLTHTI